MKKITLILFLLTFCFNANSQSTINITTSGGSYASEKWVSITTEVDGGGTQVWGQGDGTYGDGQGLINEDISIAPGTYYVNCYDLFSDGWDGTLISVTAYGSVIGDNGGESPSDSSTVDTDGTWETPADELEASFMIVVPEAPSCDLPSALTLDAVTNTTATISWTAGGTETTWEYVLEAYDSDSDEPTGTSYSTTSNPLSVTGLTANTSYDFYVRADCGGGDFSNWIKGSFSTNCDIADGALSHDFDTLDNNNLVVDASCWSVVNGGDANTWGLVQNSTTNNISWRITYSSTAHDDYLYSPAITVLDGVTDAFNFKGWSSSSTYVESINLLVVDATDNAVIATLESDLVLPYVTDAADATRFTYDLSAYEGQDVKIGFHSSTTDLLYAYLDEFTLDAFSTLGTATKTLEGFTLYPTIVKEELNFRSQNNVEAITVFNLLGQKVFSGAPNTNNSSINLSNLRPGVYVVKVSAEGKIGSYKIVKE
jgi:hypothetical protein